MTWEIVAGLVSLSGFLITFCTVVSKNTAAMTKLETTLKDFRDLCKSEGIEILEIRAESRHPIGKMLLALGCKNLGASRIIARISKRRD